jgi:LuxR family maltose regulon positive regulatory protein
MAGEEIRRHGGDPTALVGWASRSRALSQYFASEVRVAMSVDEQALVERTAHLPSLEPDLCDLVTGRRDCAELLDRLCVRNLFTEPVAGVPDAYRYHPLFAGEMARHHRQADRGSLSDTLGAAADWYAERGDTDRAIEAALRAGDGGRTAGLLRSVAGPMLRRGQAAQLVSWLERMPQDDLWNDPALALALARACGLAGDSLTPRAVLRTLGPQLAAAREQSPGLRVAAALLESSTRGWEGRLATMGEPLSDIPERLGELAGDPMLAICALDETALGNSRVRAHLMGGDLAAAIRETSTALTPAEIQTPSRYTVVSVGLRALALAWSGDEPQAREAVAQGMRVLRRFAGTGTDALWLHLASVWVADEPQAATSRDQIQEYAARTGLPYIRALAALAACAWHLRLGSLADAATAHTAARREVEHLPEPGFLATLVERFRTDPRLIPEPSAELNRQETLMLRLLAQGATRSQIAAQTSYSVNTVKTYLRSAYRKLGITDREQAVAAAVALGLVEPGATDEPAH